MVRDLVCATVLLALSAGYYAAASGLGRSALSDEVGPGGLPTVYAIVLGVLAVGIAVRAIVRHFVHGSGAPVTDAAVSLRTRIARAGGLLAIAVIYLLIVNVIGYLPAIALTLLAVLVHQGEPFGKKTVVVAVAGAGFLWVLFQYLLGVPMPGFAGL